MFFLKKKRNEKIGGKGSKQKGKILKRKKINKSNYISYALIFMPFIKRPLIKDPLYKYKYF